MNNTPCNYKDSDGSICNRPSMPALFGDLCVFHFWSQPKADAEHSAKNHDLFRSSLEKLIAAKDGKWRGFVFPISFRFSNVTIDFELDARETLFTKAVRLDGIQFLKSVDFTNARFADTFLATGVTFSHEANFIHSRFEGPFELQRVIFSRPVSFHRAEFIEPVNCRAYFKMKAIFDQVSFGSSVNFIGWRNVNAQLQGVLLVSGIATATFASNSTGPAQSSMATRVSKAASSGARYLMHFLRERLRRSRTLARNIISRAHARVSKVQRQFAKTSPNTEVFPVFGDTVEFTGITFASPSVVCFNEVNMSHAYIRGTNLRGARFLNVNWWQPTLHRNGLYDEVFIRNSGDGAFIWSHLPLLEETYRNVRLALEENKSYAAAADFYVGEMEAYRTRLGFWRGGLFSVPAWYRFLTMYGTSVLRGCLVLLFLILLHAAITVVLQHIEMGQLLEKAPELILRSIRLAALQQDESLGKTISTSQGWIDVVYRILSAAQVALLVFAFRTRIKRH